MSGAFSSEADTARRPPDASQRLVLGILICRLCEVVVALTAAGGPVQEDRSSQRILFGAATTPGRPLADRSNAALFWNAAGATGRLDPPDALSLMTQRGHDTVHHDRGPCDPGGGACHGSAHTSALGFFVDCVIPKIE